MKRKTPLNPEQLAVVEHGKGPLRVGAVAGSGKTTALVERVAHLIEAKKVPPNRILMISFSRVARDEIKKRIDKRLPGIGAGNCARTFHSIGLNIFKREIDPERRFELDTTGIMYLKATEKAYRSMHMEPEKKGIIRFAGLVKNNLLGTDETLRRLGRVDPRMMEMANDCAREAKAVDGADLLQAYFKAERIRAVEGVEHRGEHVRFVTFDDMIYQAAMLLKKNAVRERWGAQWDWVLQDECQDENEAQAAIAEALCSRTRNYTVVGDPAQSVYGWRGSKPEKMLSFEKDWPGAKTIVMHRNYRSGIEIVSLANEVMGHMPAGTVVTDEIGDPTMMTSERKTHAYVGAHVFADEAAQVAANIREHKRGGIPYAEQAVLVRMNRMTRDVEIALAKRGVPYRLLSGQSFFLMKEAQVLLGYLRVLLNRADEAAFKACLMNPSRKLGNAFVKKVAEGHDMVKKDWLRSVDQVLSSPKLGSFQRKQGEQWVRWMRNERVALKPTQDPEPILKRLRDRLKLDDHFNRNQEDQEDSKSSENLDAVCEFALHFGSCSELLDTVEKVERWRSLNARQKDAVTISTIHKAKGAEWQVVYVIQVAQGLFPSDKADLNEERRCFYVACTRAKDELWISRPAIDGWGEETVQSRFMWEAGMQELDGEDCRLGRATDNLVVGTQMGLL